MVTEKSTGLIDIYQVDDGRASDPVTHPSSGAVPFGFGFNSRGIMVVSEAAASAASSYKVNKDHFKLVTPSVLNTQAAACWVAISKNGRFAYTANAASGTISSYAIAANGSLTLMNAVAGATGDASSHPIDMSFSRDGSFLYALNSVTNAITAFEESRMAVSHW